jgi:DNA-binding SARP family transcriptional activator
VRLAILGPLLVVDDAGREISVAAARQRTLLAALLVRANRMLSVDELAELVWDGAPPAGAARTVRSYLARLRRAVGPTVAERIVTHDPGCCCRVAEHELDTLEFEALCRQADRTLRAEDWHRAAATATTALTLWRGPLLPDVTSQTCGNRSGGGSSSCAYKPWRTGPTRDCAWVSTTGWCRN